MTRDYKCPYFTGVYRGKLVCEFASIKPPDNQAKNEFLDNYCGGGDSYKSCPLYLILDKYYKRKYADWEGDK